MKIILVKDVDNLGLAGQVLTVAPGYARNFLLPTGAALLATEANLKLLAEAARRESEKARREEAETETEGDGAETEGDGADEGDAETASGGDEE